MSMSLTSLPPELVSCVVANLAAQPDSLCDLARCSRQLYCYTVPHLYRHVTIQESVGAGELRDEKLKNLAAVLLRRPDLAGHVRHFTLHVARAPGTLREFMAACESEKHTSPELAKFGQGFTLSEEEKISCLGQFSHTHGHHHDLILALLLPALLKVEQLVVDLDPDFDMKTNRDKYYFDQMLQRAAARAFDIQPPFEALKVFVQSHDDFRTTDVIASLLKLPAIQEISGGFTSTIPLRKFTVTDENLVELNSSSSPLTSLDLADFGLSIADLSHIFRVPKALKMLSFLVCTPDSIKFTNLRDALRPQENCLESLSLDYGRHFCENRTFPPMTSFINLNNLKMFKITVEFLARTDTGTGRHSLINIFPPSLETLHLTRIQCLAETFLDALEHLLARKSPQQIPSLKILILEYADFFDATFLRRIKLANPLWDSMQETAIERLGRAAAHGVSIEIIESWTDK
ncbi:hypothetical protein MMC22_009060 [Lobaria immixta]|nr:hypothetical protein [Lobaria immixta]